MPSFASKISGMEILGYFAALLIGVSLGLIGGGGSILTVPVMVYLFGLQPLLATSYSLFIVGSTSLVGAWKNFNKGFVNIRAALLFGASSVLTVYVTRRFLLPALPETFFTLWGFEVTESVFTMTLFALLMVVASVNMIRTRVTVAEEKECSTCMRVFRLAGYGIVLGLLTGLLGAGGGFLLIPVLVTLLRMPMKRAVGTSLLIIALNSLVGFAGDIGHFKIDWLLLAGTTLMAIIGIFIGTSLAKKISGPKLKQSFGWFILTMGIYILLKEMFL